MQIRAFQNEDYTRFVEIRNQISPHDHVTVDAVRLEDRFWDAGQCARVRLVAASMRGEVLGYVEIYREPFRRDERTYWMDVGVDRCFRRRGIGKALCEHLSAQLIGRAGVTVRTLAESSGPAHIAFLEHLGFDEVQRAWQLALDVQPFDFTAFAKADKRVATQGIVITTLAEESEHGPDAVRHVYELYSTCRRDAPTLDGTSSNSFESWLSAPIEEPARLSEACFLAKDGDRYVGVSTLDESPSQPGILRHSFTGVLLSHRGRGIALGLKLRTIRFAQIHGYRELHTINNNQNVPILQINEGLGYKKGTALIVFEKILT